LSVGLSGTGSLTLAGASTVDVGTSRNVFVGRDAGGSGVLTFGSGSTVNAGYVGLGSVVGARGELVVDGVGSQVTLATASTNGLPAAGFLDVGRSGIAVATVSNGGRVLISDNGGDTRASTNSPGMQLGRDAGGSGKLTITGAGSTVEIIAMSLGLAPGVPDNLNPFVAVGRFAGATGELVISNGGKLLVQGNAVSTATDTRQTNVMIGGNSDTDAGGSGKALVTGLGSELRVAGNDAFIRVGRGPGASGQLTIADQGLVSSTNLTIGRVGGGTLLMDNGTLNLSGQFTSDTVTGATLSIGNRGGTGVATVTNGSHVNLTNLGTSGASLNLGGTGPNPFGNGTLTVAGASQISLAAAPGLATFSVGRDGTGLATIKESSTVDIGDGSTFIGRLAGSDGTLILNSGASLNAGYVGVGRTARNGADGGSGRLIISDSTVTAGTVEIGTHGFLGGNNGTINGDVILHGEMSPGESPGRIKINGSIRTGSGHLVLDVAANGNSFDIDHLILTEGSTFNFTGLEVTFNFLGATDPNAFALSGGFDLDNFLQSLSIDGVTLSGLSSQFAQGQTWDTVFATASFDARSQDYVITDLTFSPDGSATFVATPAVPEPGTWALMFAGLVAVSTIARRRAARA
jgi:T5SS/PEP-CTERM-associated repeat protein